MSIPNEALQKLLQEIEQKAAVSQQQIAVTRAQIQGKNRESRLAQLTTAELAALPPHAKVYEGVGKMFAYTPTADLQEKLAKQDAEAKADASNLETKLHYLETTAKNSREHIEQILSSAGRGR